MAVEILPDALATKWKTFQKEFEQVCSIHILRWIHTVSQQVTLHGFCDASELAYASVIYAVQPQVDVVLSWLSSHPKNWKPYIANRTSEILDLVPADSWRYVPIEINAADVASRVLSPKELPTCVLWYRATATKQLMGDLPAHRITPSRPFSACGADYAGPINVLR
ncbi:DUF1758 domain-containing protein [Trichonephila clavata]|uniref:DUF1758 domain-containing protein n=1 Tax=Trichonephila clavata TaxID=2740835 RepID=A0A8X6M2M1_TRICU|nr:DUF1758 domain-containing protein [Trichonephila clavata]